VTKAGLKRHKNSSKHSECRYHFCNSCPKTFHRKDNRDRHVSSVHGDPGNATFTATAPSGPYWDRNGGTPEQNQQISGPMNQIINQGGRLVGAPYEGPQSVEFEVFPNFINLTGSVVQADRIGGVNFDYDSITGSYSNRTSSY